MWLKVTHLSNMPGESLVSNWPKKRMKRYPGRWIVFDKDATPNPWLPAHALSDHETFEEAAKACLQHEEKQP